jgi:hypothetical protein
VLAGASGAEPLRAGLAAWRDFAFEAPGPPSAARRRAREFLLPDPRRGGACKRLLMLARWCVRPDDGLDLGLWSGGALAAKDLVIPLDVHVFRIARQVGLTARGTPDWKAAVEVTRSLRAFDPDDPVRFDFALARPGILGRCLYRRVEEVCAACDLRPACSVGRRPVTSRSRSPSCSPRTTSSPPRSSRTRAP